MLAFIVVQTARESGLRPAAVLRSRPAERPRSVNMRSESLDTLVPTRFSALPATTTPPVLRMQEQARHHRVNANRQDPAQRICVPTISSRIPNYRLQRCHDENPELRSARRITLRDGFKALNLALWDERRGKLISFGEYRLLYDEAAQVSGHHRRADWLCRWSSTWRSLRSRVSTRFPSPYSYRGGRSGSEIHASNRESGRRRQPCTVDGAAKRKSHLCLPGRQPRA